MVFVMPTSEPSGTDKIRGAKSDCGTFEDACIVPLNDPYASIRSHCRLFDTCLTTMLLRLLNVLCADTGDGRFGGGGGFLTSGFEIMRLDSDGG